MNPITCTNSREMCVLLEESTYCSETRFGHLRIQLSGEREMIQCRSTRVYVYQTQ